MKNPFLLFLLLFLSQKQGSSQDSLHADSVLKDYLNTLATIAFSFDSPGDGFDKLSDGSGFTCVSKKTTIKYIVVPGSYERAISEIREKKVFEKNATTNEIDTFSIYKGDRHLLFLLSEMIAPPGVNEENMFLLTTFMPYSATITLGIIGAYPKSRDAEMRKKLVDAAFTLHKL